MSDDACLELVLNASMWTFEDSTRAAADAQIRDMVQTLHVLGWHPPEIPDLVKVDQQPVAPREDWFERAWKRAKYEALTRWAPRDRAVMELDLGLRNMSLVNNHAQFTVQSLIAGLSTIPFTLGTVGHVFYGAQWKYPADFFKTPGFAGGHGRPGLGAVFRGDGHNVLVSAAG